MIEEVEKKHKGHSKESEAETGGVVERVLNAGPKERVLERDASSSGGHSTSPRAARTCHRSEQMTPRSSYDLCQLEAENECSSPKESKI